MIPNNNYTNAAYLVTVYQVDYDILSWGQYAASWPMWLFGLDHIPEAVGTKVPISSQYGWAVFSALVLGPFSPIIGLGTILYSGVQCHMMNQVIYGMEQRIMGG